MCIYNSTSKICRGFEQQKYSGRPEDNFMQISGFSQVTVTEQLSGTGSTVFRKLRRFFALQVNTVLENLQKQLSKYQCSPLRPYLRPYRNRFSTGNEPAQHTNNLIQVLIKIRNPTSSLIFYPYTIMYLLSFQSTIWFIL